MCVSAEGYRAMDKRRAIKTLGAAAFTVAVPGRWKKLATSNIASDEAEAA